MPETRSGRLAFGLAVCIALLIIGRNLYRHHLNSQLVAAVQVMDATAIRTLLERGADPNSRFSDSSEPEWRSTVLSHLVRFHTASPGEADSLCLLIQHGADLHTPDCNFLLTNACQTGSIKVVRCLLERGADANAQSSFNQTPLSGAISYGEQGYGKYHLYGEYRLNDEYDFGRTPPDADPEIRKRRCQEMIQLLCQHGARLTLEEKVQLGDVAGVRAALETGTPADQLQAPGESALYEAARRGDLTMMTLLLAHGADVNRQDGFGQWPLSAAAARGELLGVKLLLAHHALVNPPAFTARHVQGLPPLLMAIINKHLAVVHLLLKQGADPNTPNVMWQAMSAFPEAVPDLLAHGARVSTDDSRAAFIAHRSDSKSIPDRA